VVPPKTDDNSEKYDKFISEHGDADGKHHIDILFTGDMERQLFVSHIWDFKSGDGQGGSDDEEEDEFQENAEGRGQPKDENQDSMSEDDKGSESEGDLVDAALDVKYD